MRWKYLRLKRLRTPAIASGAWANVRPDPGWRPPKAPVTYQAGLLKVCLYWADYIVCRTAFQGRSGHVEYLGDIWMSYRNGSGWLVNRSKIGLLLMLPFGIASAQTSPVPVNGLKLWLKGDSGVILSSGRVSKWTDQSGSGTNAVQTAASNQPLLIGTAINGKPAVRFDGVGTFMTFNLPLNGLSAITLVLVATSTQSLNGGSSGVANAPLFWNETASWGTVHLSPFQGVVRYRFGTGQLNNLPSFTRPLGIGNAPSVTVAVKNGTAESLFVDGNNVLTQTGKLASIANVKSTGNLGRGYNDNTYFGGDVAEVLVYNRALTDSERQAVEAYLRGKYATAPPPPVNQQPSVFAGPDQSLSLPNTATLTGTATDDGLPSHTLTTSWQQVSGPSAASLVSPNSLSTGVSFLQAGTYSFRLTASDGSLTATDDVVVTVNPKPAPVIPTTGLRLWLRSDTGVQVSNGAVATWSDQSSNHADAVQADATKQPQFVASAMGGKPALRFDGTSKFLTFTLPVTGLSSMSLFMASATSFNGDGGWNGVENAPLFWDESGSWGTLTFSPLANVIKYRFGTGEVNNLPAYLRPVSASGTPTITTAIKNGPVETLYVNGTAAMSQSGKLTPLANVQATGSLGRGYNNTFFAGDIGETIVYDRALTDAEREQVESYLMNKFSIVALAPPPVFNQAPVVSAGSGQTITLPATANLSGSATDDGLPSNTLSVQWTKASGPGIVSFSNATSTTTLASFSVAGSYVLRLTATDGAFTSYSDVALIVNPQPPPPPVLSSGVFIPADSGVINVKTQYGAKGDGITDDTAALQRAIRENILVRNRILYFPDGTYLIRDALYWKSCVDGQTGCVGAQGWHAYLAIQGQSEAGTIIRLADNTAAFGNPAAPKSVIKTASEQNDAQRTDGGGDEAYVINLFNFTIDTGSGNPGAVGLEHVGSNESAVRHVTIRSSDPQHRGVRGLDLLRPYTGPQHFKYVTIDGFDYGIDMASYYFSGASFEHITIRNQRVAGVRNTNNIVSIRDLNSSNAVPAVRNVGGHGLFTLIESNLSGGVPGVNAIENADNSKMFIRQVTTSDYSSAVLNGTSAVPSGYVDEYVSHAPVSLFAGTSSKSLRLPVQETPEYNDTDPANWANIQAYGAVANDLGDDGPAIQAAIDSGKTVVYLPYGIYRVNNPILVRGNVRRIVGFGAQLTPLNSASPTANGSPVIRFVGSTTDVMLDNVQFRTNYQATGTPHFTKPEVQHSTSRTVVLQDLIDMGYENVDGVGTGPVFMENVCCGTMTFNHQKVWARQFNVEVTYWVTHVVNNGSDLWALLFKTETTATLLENRNGARTEILGGFFSSHNQYASPTRPMFISTDSQFSMGITTHPDGDSDFGIVMQETRNGVTQNLFRAGSTSSPRALPRQAGSAVPLLTGGY